MAGENIQELTMEQDQTSLLFTLPITISNSGTVNYLLGTKDRYLNGNIGISTTTPAATISFSQGSFGNKNATIKSASTSNIVTNTSNNNSGIVLALQGTASCSSSSYTNTAGWLDAHNSTTTNTGVSTTTWDGTTYYVDSVTVIATKTFGVTNAGTVNITNTGTAVITSNSTSAGTVTVKAKVAAGDSTTTDKNVVENGLWKLQTMAAANTDYYGRVRAAALTITTSSTNDGMSTYFNTGSSSDKNVTITPKYTNTTGFKTETTTATNNGGTTYWKIKTVTPTFAAAPGGGSTASSSQVTMDTTSTSAGIEIQTAYTINAATITYKAAATGWIDKAKDASTGSSTTAKSSTNGTKYYVTGVTVPASKSLAVTNNGTTNVTNNSTTTVTSGIASSTPKGTINVNAYPASGTTLDGSKKIVENGRWVLTSVSASGTYYGKVTVASGSVTAPATISGSSATVTTGTNTVTFTKTISVTPNVTTAGYISSGTAGNSSVSLTASITTKAAATITPGTSNKEIAAGTYLTGKQTIAGDADLVASNIKHNVNIFGVVGTFTSSGTQASGQTVASAAHIRSGYSAWVNGQEVQGSIGAVSFANDLPSGQEQSNYSDISDVTGTPVLVAGKGLYISAGYIENTYISTAHLVPDGTDVQGHAGYILSGHTALDQDGNLVTGNIPSRSWPTTTSTSATSGYSGTTFNASTSERYINLPSGYYGSNNYYFIRKITTSGIAVGNIRYGATIQVGDSGSATRIANTAGTFTQASTATSSNGAAAAAQILKDYGAWVDGTEVTGSIPTYTGAYTITT